MLLPQLHQSDTRPFDGTEGHVLAMLKFRLRKAASEIVEEKIFLEHQQERRAMPALDPMTSGLPPSPQQTLRSPFCTAHPETCGSRFVPTVAQFDEETAELLPATKAAMKAEIKKPFESRSFVLQVLEFLRLLCEGHNNELQELLCEQSALSSANIGMQQVSNAYPLQGRSFDRRQIKTLRHADGRDFDACVGQT